METKQTAVEWFYDQITRTYWDYMTSEEQNLLFEQAKQMEKEQIKDAFVECWQSNVPEGIECKLDAEQYYNENYGK
jgi:hypothetical protein